MSLRGRDIGSSKAREQRREPSALEHDVLIDLADDRVRGCADARVDRGGGARAARRAEAQTPMRLPRSRSSRRDPSRLPSSTAMISNGTAVRLREDGGERGAEERRPLCTGTTKLTPMRAGHRGPARAGDHSR